MEYKYELNPLHSINIFSGVDRGEKTFITNEEQPNSHTVNLRLESEPAGQVVFGELNDNQKDILATYIKSKSMGEGILTLKDDCDSYTIDINGIFSYGDDGDQGKEGIIEIIDKKGIYADKDGIYFCYLSLHSATWFISFETPDGLEYNDEDFV